MRTREVKWLVQEQLVGPKAGSLHYYSYIQLSIAPYYHLSLLKLWHDHWWDIGIQCNGRWPTPKFRGTYLTSSGVNEDPSPDCFLGWQLEKIRGLPTLISTSDGMGGGIHLYMRVYVAMVIHVYGVLMEIILVICICYWHSPVFDLRYQSLVKFVVGLSCYIW